MTPLTQPRPTSMVGTAHIPACPLPAIHLNGTGRAALLDEYRTTEQALTALSRALSRTTLHARDYYVLPEGAFTEATASRRAVWDLIDEISSYLDDHLRHLADIPTGIG